MNYRVDLLTVGCSRWEPMKAEFPSEDWAMTEAQRLFGRWRSIDKIRVVPIHFPKFQAYRPGSESLG